ncbi:uncharacterized protein LOC129940193 [Eupeodes corollae]|uniref:uncharacterized protein LOC129940193 n=1 Tax=Eupeodes corollae TaxID=290404 RepID=UPI0024918A3C|nr:uncharacterized protein LOC129940193 [Eupeodes corollae]
MDSEYGGGAELHKDYSIGCKINSCIARDICMEYSRLARRLQKLQPKRHKRRLRNLASPKNIVPKVKPIETYQLDNSIKTEIIRELPGMTRTQQLAYPRVRNILPIRKYFRNILGRRRLQVLNTTLKKSMLSVYSRLADCQPPEEKKPVQKWTEKEWTAHRRYLHNLAQPKKKFKPPKQVHMWKDILIMNRFKYLCKPKDRPEVPAPKWELTKGLKNYEPTEIILRLSKPKEIDENVHHQSLPVKIPHGALKYKPTERILQLTTQAEKRLGESDLKENPFGVAPNALKAKASQRIVELAQAKEYEEGHIRNNPYQISPAALKAKPTARTIALAQPKGS